MNIGNGIEDNIKRFGEYEAFISKGDGTQMLREIVTPTAWGMH